MTNSAFTSRAALLAKSKKNLAIITASGLALTGALTVGLTAGSSQAATPVQSTPVQSQTTSTNSNQQSGITSKQSGTTSRQSGVTAPSNKHHSSHHSSHGSSNAS